MAKHQEDWAGFPGAMGEDPALVSVDLGWADSGPDRKRPTLIRVSVAIPNPDDEGSANAFLQEIQPFDEALTRAFTNKLGAAHVAFMLTPTHRWWVFYAPSAKGADELLKSAAAACPGHAPKLESRDDPKWKYFESDLFPDLGQQRYIADYSVIMQLMENGDDGEAERPIEHLAYFPTEESRDEFVAWCGANGFKVTEVDDEADDETEAFAVEFNHIGPAVIDDVWEKTMLATEGAELFGGEYDGWQCSVVGEDGKPVLE